MRLPWVVGGEERLRRCEPLAVEPGGSGNLGSRTPGKTAQP